MAKNTRSYRGAAADMEYFLIIIKINLADKKRKYYKPHTNKGS